MKENSVSFQAYLSAGIRPTADYVMQNPALLSAMDARVSPYGLLQPNKVENPFATEPKEASYPWPQLLRGRPYHILAYEDALYRVDSTWNSFGESSDFLNWSQAQIQAMDMTDESIPLELPTGTDEPWHFADFGASWFLFKPDVTVFKANLSGWRAEGDDPIRAQTRVTIGTGCAHKGRLITAGFDKDNVFDSAAWLTLWNQYYGESPEVNPIATLPNQIDKNYVMWSTIGGGDTLALFYPEMFIEGSRSLYPDYIPGVLDEPLYLQFLKRNEMGWMPMESDGEVYKVMSLGEDVAVYTEDAVYLLIQSGITFGLRKMLNVGVLSRSAVGGTQNVHTFIDVEGGLWRWTAGGDPVCLGFKQMFNAANVYYQPVCVSVDERNNDTYINTSTFCGLLSPSGMSTLAKTAPRFSEGFYQDGSMMMVGEDTTVDDGANIYFATQKNDLQRAGSKKVTLVEVVGHFPSDAVFTLSVQSEAIDGSILVKVITQEGSTLFRVDLAGMNFIFILQVAIVDKTVDYNITNLLVTYQADDNRFVRGTYVRTA